MVFGRWQKVLKLAVSQNENEQFIQELKTYRRILVLAGTVYLLWWFAVKLSLPQAYNPFLSRSLVVAIIFAFLGWTYVAAWAQNNIRLLVFASVWLITAHFYYLFYENGGDSNWIVGTYITVIAINLCFVHTPSLLAYSIFVAFLSSAVVVLIPSLRDSIFLPGLLTILLQANISLRTRQGIIKNLMESNERFQLLFHSTFDGILVHENGRILNVNESMTKISGFARHELIGKSVLDILDPSVHTSVSAKFSLDDIPPYQTKGLTKDGKIIEVEVRAKPFIYDRRPAKLVTVQDMRDRKKAEEEKIKSLTLAENIRVRDEFISIASHELKTPISSLRLQTQMLEKDLRRNVNLAGGAEEVEEAVQLFKRQIDRLTELVDSMLDVSRISAGRFIIEWDEVDLVKLSRQAIDLLSTQNSSTGAPPILLHAPTELKMQGDHRRLEQVLENLLSNAIKYGAGKQITVKIGSSSEEILIEVLDQGIGIEAHAIHKIFERFERAVSSRNISGLGLGLYITRQIVEAHGGHLSVESEPGRGSNFRVHFKKSQAAK